MYGSGRRLTGDLRCGSNSRTSDDPYSSHARNFNLNCVMTIIHLRVVAKSTRPHPGSPKIAAISVVVRFSGRLLDVLTDS